MPSLQDIAAALDGQSSHQGPTHVYQYPLKTIRQIEGDEDALERFEAVAEDNLYVEMPHG